MSELLSVLVAVCLVYLLLVGIVYVVLACVSAFESGIRRRESAAEDYRTLASSRFTIPVSIVVAAYNEETSIIPSIRSMLELDYPEYEVIVVDDGSSDNTLDRLREVFELEEFETFVRPIFPSADVRAMYRSRKHPNLVVVEKENSGKAEALNAGLNVARYRYVCGVDADTVLASDALLKGMRLVVQDPGRIVGVTSHLAISQDPGQAMKQRKGRRRIDRRPFIVYQHLDYLRAFLNNRLAWSRLGFMLCSVGAFQIWRRDVLEELGGYAQGFTCEDIELTFRVHEHFLRTGREYAVLSLPDEVGTTEGPDTVRKLVSQRERWQRVIDETVWHYRNMWFNPRFKSVGLVGVPFYLVTEVGAPAVELLSVVLLFAAVASGLFDVGTFALMCAAIAFLNAMLTACAILLDDVQSRTYRRRDLTRLLLLAPFDLFVYRPIIVWARLKGSWRFLRGDKEWHKFERNVRAQMT